MKTKLIVFGDTSSPSYPQIETVIANSFAYISGNDKVVRSVAYSDMQKGMADIAGTLKTHELIAIFADENMFLELKRNICKALKFEMIHNDTILSRLQSMEYKERYMMHALMPKNATVFPLTDGLFSGFAIRSKTQCILFLPLSEDRTFITMKKYVFPYIQRIFGATLPDFGNFEISYAAKILEKCLSESDAQIAIANTPLCKYIAKASKKIECFPDHISYAPYDEKHSDKTTNKLSAVRAAEYYECRYGASIVEVSPDEDGIPAVVITISNKSTATIRTLSAIPDETKADFMQTVVTEFFLMLAEEIASEEEEEEQPEPKCVKPYKAISAFRVIIYLVLMAAAGFLTYMTSTIADLPLFS